MKHISIIVPRVAVLGSVDDPRHLFQSLNDFLRSARQPPMYKIQLVGLDRKVPLHDGSFTVNTDALLNEVKKTDLVIIPA